MSLVQDYKASLKSIEVEEPIDVLVHRPLGFLLAKALLHTKVSPNALTVFSMLLGICAGVCMLWQFPYHLIIAGGLVFLSAVVDCSDGQLARMRKSSSSFGRMLDGVVDSVVLAAVVLPLTYMLWKQYRESPWLAATLVALWVVAVIVSSFHTSLYDHYKNLYLYFTLPQYSDAEDVQTANKRRNSDANKAANSGILMSLVWSAYTQYLRSQSLIISDFDPYTMCKYSELPPYDPAMAQMYRRSNSSLMRVWKSLFGVGSLMFGLAVFTALGRPDIYLVFRFFFMNAVFYLYLRPAQRKASQQLRLMLAARGAAKKVQQLPN